MPYIQYTTDDRGDDTERLIYVDSETEAFEKLKLYANQIGAEFSGLRPLDFGDAWAKVYTNSPDTDDFERWESEYGIRARDFTVVHPGQHPCGNCYLVKINEDVYGADVTFADD